MAEFEFDGGEVGRSILWRALTTNYLSFKATLHSICHLYGYFICSYI